MRVLGLDLGEQRTGVALSDPMGWLASPLTVLAHTSQEADMAAIEELTHQHKVVRVVVGYPRNMNGTVGAQARRVERYVAELQQRLSVPVVLWDERLSTAQAERLIHESGRRVRRERIDAAAAAVILQSYLDAQSLAGTASTAGD
jgi:putative Holliday junction resolvase